MNLTSWKAWKEYLKDKLILDEYGEKVPYEKFVEIIEAYKNPTNIRSKYQHNTEGKKNGTFNPEYDWDDDEGYPFTAREFL